MMARAAVGAALAGVAGALRRREPDAGSTTPRCSRAHACGGCPSQQRCPLPPAAARRNAAGLPEDPRS